MNNRETVFQARENVIVSPTTLPPSKKIATEETHASLDFIPAFSVRGVVGIAGVRQCRRTAADRDNIDSGRTSGFVRHQFRRSKNEPLFPGRSQQQGDRYF